MSEQTNSAPESTELVNMSQSGREGVTPIDRSSRFGNPFKLAKDGGEYETRDEVVERYREWFDNKVATDPDFYQAVQGLRGKTLGCWCVPKGCHGHVILQYLELTEQEGDA